MIYRGSGKLIPLSTLLVGMLFITLAAFAFGFGFLTYVQSLSHDAETLVDETAIALAKAHERTATGAAALMAPRLFRRTLLMTFVDEHSRVTVFHHASDSRHTLPTIVVRLPDDRSGTPSVDGLLARFVLGSAAICGLHVLRADVNGIAIGISDDDPVLVAQMRAYIPLVVASGIGIALLTITLGTLLNRSALRPLVDVTSALERLALGDFTVHFVESGRDGQLGVLARAYNRAVARVEQAFRERDEANAAMRRFVADAGHQLRTPLTVIRGFIAILDQAHSADVAHVLRVMDEQSVLMSALIDNLILLDRWALEKSSTARPVDVSRLTEDIVSRTADTHPGRDIVFRGAAADEILVRADPGEITYAVTNVIDNALNYTHGSVRVVLEANDVAVAIVVSDDGPGMRREVVERACDRFYRGERRDVAGSGLGLAIAKRAVERAGGTITIDSEIERGTNVAMRFPRIVTGKVANVFP